MVLEARKCIIKVLVNLVSGESLISGLQMANFSLCSSVAEKERALDLSSFYKGC